jgi:hypothetical protein
MKSLIILIALAFVSSSAAQDMDRYGYEKQSYAYVYPEIVTPHCSPSNRFKTKEWYTKHREIILTEDAQNLQFYNHFKKLANNHGANAVDAEFISRVPENYTNSRVVLTGHTLNNIEKLEREKGKKINALFFNYGHADDYSYVGTPATELPDYGKRVNAFNETRAKLRYPQNHWLNPGYETKDASKTKERIFTLNKMQERGIKVYIYNRFYNIPNYIKQHENVTILFDKKDFITTGWQANQYTWTNINGQEINGGFLGIPWNRNYLERIQMHKNRILGLKVNGKIYNYRIADLSAESQEQALRLIGDYKCIAKSTRGRTSTL